MSLIWCPLCDKYQTNSRVFFWTTVFSSLTPWSRRQILSSSSEWNSLIRQTADTRAKLVCLLCGSLLIAQECTFPGVLCGSCGRLSSFWQGRLFGPREPRLPLSDVMGQFPSFACLVKYLRIAFPKTLEHYFKHPVKNKCHHKRALLWRSVTLSHSVNVDWALSLMLGTEYRDR